MTMTIGYATRKGLAREENEDRFLAKKFENGAALLAVADGMGGQAAGERASQMVVSIFDGLNPDAPEMEAHLVELVRTARRKICEASAEDESLKGMGTTLTLAFVKDSVAQWIHVGDSRLYLFREEMLIQVTEDQNVAGLLLRAGEITPEEARVHQLRNMLFSHLGREDFELDMGSLNLSPGDVLVLSTDGLHDSLTESQVEAILYSNADLQDRVRSLVQAALEAGARDDATVVVVET